MSPEQLGKLYGWGKGCEQFVRMSDGQVVTVYVRRKSNGATTHVASANELSELESYIAGQTIQLVKAGRRGRVRRRETRETYERHY